MCLACTQATVTRITKIKGRARARLVGAQPAQGGAVVVSGAHAPHTYNQHDRLIGYDIICGKSLQITILKMKKLVTK